MVYRPGDECHGDVIARGPTTAEWSRRRDRLVVSTMDTDWLRTAHRPVTSRRNTFPCDNQLAPSRRAGGRRRERRVKLPMMFQAEVIDVGALVVVKLCGELDLASVERLRAVERRVADANNPVVFDLADLEFIDVAGIRALVATVDRLRSWGRAVAVCSVPPWTRKVAELVGVSSYLGEVEFVSSPG